MLGTDWILDLTPECFWRVSLALKEHTGRFIDPSIWFLAVIALGLFGVLALLRMFRAPAG